MLIVYLQIFPSFPGVTLAFHYSCVRKKKSFALPEEWRSHWRGRRSRVCLTQRKDFGQSKQPSLGHSGGPSWTFFPSFLNAVTQWCRLLLQSTPGDSMRHLPCESFSRFPKSNCWDSLTHVNKGEFNLCWNDPNTGLALTDGWGSSTYSIF